MERRRFAGSWAEIGNFFTERLVEHWKGLPREVVKECGTQCSGLIDQVVFRQSFDSMILDIFFPP